MENQNQKKLNNNKQNQPNPKNETDAVQADKAIELMRYNKINAKNAFDINVDFIESLSNILNKNEEAAWQKASASLDVSAKVYGYRVDSVHSETFQFLGGLNRNKKGENQNKENVEEEKESEEEKKNVKVRRGQNTLETNLNKLNLTKYDLDTEVDPLFSIMTSKFNEINANGLLLNTIPLDERLNYILESKKVDNKNKKLNDDKNKENVNSNQNEEIKDMDINSDDSYENLRSKKEKKDPFILNLERNNYLDEESEPPIPIICSEDMTQLPDTIKSALIDFKSQNPIDLFVKEKVCPELTIFKQSRELTENENNELFLKHFKDEINRAELKKNNDYLEGQEGIPEEPDNIESSEHLDMENIPEDANDESNNNENVIDPNDIKDIEDSSMDPNLPINRGELNNNLSMSLFKYDDLIEHSEKFGSGNIDFLKDLPQFNQFQQNFGKIEGKNFFNKNIILGLNKKKEGGHRKKKEEILFEFNEDNEIDINELLTDKGNKNKKKKGYDFTNDFENKKKVKCFYNYDKLATFRLFTINNKTIFSREIDNDINLIEQEKKIIDKIEEEQYDNNDFGNNDMEGFDNSERQNNSKEFNNNAFFQSEKEIEKNFGRLYRRFDIRSLKNKIWNNYENQYPRDNIDFRNIISNMSKEMTEDELYSISTSTCFVCMLHLCNEKNLFVNQNDINTFYVEKDSDGYKSELISKRKGDDDVTKPKTRKKKNKKIENNDEDEDEDMIMNEE